MRPRTSTPVVAIACGGTGGHLFPGLAVAGELQKRDCAVTLLVSPKEVDQQALKTKVQSLKSKVPSTAPTSASGRETSDFRLETLDLLSVATLPAVALQGGRYLAFARGFWQSWRAARKLFRARPPHAALAMGGFTSAPPILAARSSGAKTFIHESNAIPGRANRWLARLVDQAFVGFPSAVTRLSVREATVTGTPVRTEFLTAGNASAASARAALGLDPAKPVLLVMGGSQGARGVNELILSALPLLAKGAAHWQWLHLTGPNDFGKVKRAYAAACVNAVVHPFLAEMHLALGAATAAVSRAGASSLAELAAVRVPALLVPYPFAADNHQYHNARAFAETGAAWLLEQKDAQPETVARLLAELMTSDRSREKIQAALARWHAPRAAELVADAILRACAGAGAKTQRRAQSDAPYLTTRRSDGRGSLSADAGARVPGAMEQRELTVT